MVAVRSGFLNGGLVLAVSLCLAACMSAAADAATPTPPAPDHIVVVIMSTRSYDEIFNNEDAPYLNSLVSRGTLFSNSQGMDTHFSQPNYFYLFSGASQQVTSDAFPPRGAPFATPNLDLSLRAAGLSFAQYSQGLPSLGYSGAGELPYAPYHNAVVSFSNVSATANAPYSADTFSKTTNPNFAALPSVAFVVPNLNTDMSNISLIEDGDRWLRTDLADYVDFASKPTSNSLFIITFDYAISPLSASQLSSPHSHLFFV